MRRLMILVILALLPSGCVQSAATTGVSDKPSVVSTIFAPYDFAREIVGDKADVTMLLPPAAETHSFEPTPQDIIKIQNCDVFIYVGGESDEWVSDVLETVDTANMRIVTLMDCVEVVEEEIVEGMEADKHEHEADEHGADEHEHEADEHEADEHEADEHEAVEYDEHVWTSPRNAKLIVQRLCDTFCEADADNSGEYRRNTAEYITRLDELDAMLQAVADGAVRKTIVFGDRFPFRYFADAYGLTYLAAFPGCSTETEPSAATVKFLIDKVNAERIPVVFHIELSNARMAETISEATGAKVMLLHSCHNISKADFEAGKTYIDFMTENVHSLKEALN